MRQIISTILFSLLVASCSKMPAVPAYSEPLRTKKVTFAIETLQDCAVPFFDNSYAEVYLGLHKMKGDGSSSVLLWDTTFSKRKLALYPSSAQPLLIEKNIAGILDSKERVFVSYIKNYDHNGTKQQVGSGQHCPAENSTLLLNVGL